MPRGGQRLNAGRKADPNSARQKRLAATKAQKPAKSKGDEWQFPNAEKPLGPPPADDSEGKKSFDSPLEYWEHVLKDPGASASAKHAAAYAMAPYVHPKIAPAAKKEDARGRAQKAATASRFAPGVAPLRSVK